MHTTARVVIRGGWLCLWIFSLLAGCTRSDVEIRETIEVPQVDNLLHIRGQVCTEQQEDVSFPVKIMFIIDCSGSMQQTDEGDHRVEAVRRVVRRYANNPQVYFNIIKFNARVSQLTGGFTNSLQGDEDDVFGAQGLLEADAMTDYQGALGVAYQALLEDMQQASLAELTRSKYVVIFFSDGTADPVCYGCVTDPPNHPRYSSECHEDLHVFCTLMDSIIINMDAMEPGMFPLLEGGADYNHNYQIFQMVDAIMELKDAFHVGEMRLHSAFLYCRDQFGNPTTPLCPAAEQAYNLDPDRGRALLRAMSERGNGTFRDFTSGQDINFLNIDYTSLKHSYGLKNLLVTNQSALPGRDGFVVDSDADGLDDDVEMLNGTNPLLADSDQDGYQDWIEQQLLSAGFDPMDPTRPEERCASPNTDADGDGLAACEEALYGTDDKLVDSDFDGFPDLYELRLGTDALRHDRAEDLDADGLSNSDELLYHSHPVRSDAQVFRNHRYWYEMGVAESEAGRRVCRRFDIRQVSLVTTLDRNGTQSGRGTRGFNDILVWYEEASFDNPFDPGQFRVACVRAQYIEPDYKVPFDGEIVLTPDDFVHPTELDLGFVDSTCVGAGR